MILSDSTKGMENQSIALAKMLNANFKLIDYNPPYFLKNFLYWEILYSIFFTTKIRYRYTTSIIITTGRRMAGTSIALKSILKNNVKTIHIQNPKLSLNNFDLLLIPEHDKIKGKNVIQTKGALCFFEEKDIKKLKNQI